MADEGDRPPLERAESRHDRAVVHPPPVAVQLEPVVEDPLDVVERVRTLVVAGELDRAPDLLVRGLLAEALDLPLQPLELRGELRPAQELDARELGEPVSQPELGVLRHGAVPNSRNSRARVERSSARGTTASTWPKRKF